MACNLFWIKSSAKAALTLPIWTLWINISKVWIVSPQVRQTVMLSVISSCIYPGPNILTFTITVTAHNWMESVCFPEWWCSSVILVDKKPFSVIILLILNHLFLVNSIAISLMGDYIICIDSLNKMSLRQWLNKESNKRLCILLVMYTLYMQMFHD